MGFHNEYNADENTILWFFKVEHMLDLLVNIIKSMGEWLLFNNTKNNSINNTYLYYLLKSIQDKIFKSQSGAAQPHVYSKDLQNIKIPIPSLERQQEIVEYCEYNDTLIKQLEKEIENNKKQAEKCITSIVKTQVLEEQDDTISLNTEPIYEVQDEIT